MVALLSHFCALLSGVDSHYPEICILKYFIKILGDFLLGSDYSYTFHSVGFSVVDTSLEMQFLLRCGVNAHLL